MIAAAIVGAAAKVCGAWAVLLAAGLRRCSSQKGKDDQRSRSSNTHRDSERKLVLCVCTGSSPVGLPFAVQVTGFFSDYFFRSRSYTP